MMKKKQAPSHRTVVMTPTAIKQFEELGKSSAQRQTWLGPRSEQDLARWLDCEPSTRLQIFDELYRHGGASTRKPGWLAPLKQRVRRWGAGDHTHRRGALIRTVKVVDAVEVVDDAIEDVVCANFPESYLRKLEQAMKEPTYPVTFSRDGRIRVTGPARKLSKDSR